VLPVAARPGREIDLRHLLRLAALIEPAYDHGCRQRLDARDPEAEAVEHLEDILQRRRRQLGDAEHPLELLRLHARQQRRVLDPQVEPGDPAPHRPHELHRPHVSKTRRGRPTCTGAKKPILE